MCKLFCIRLCLHCLNFFADIRQFYCLKLLNTIISTSHNAHILRVLVYLVSAGHPLIVNYIANVRDSNVTITEDFKTFSTRPNGPPPGLFPSYYITDNAQ